MNSMVYLSKFDEEYVAYYDDHNDCFCLILTKLNYKPPRSEVLAIGEDEIMKYLNSEIRECYRQSDLTAEYEFCESGGVSPEFSCCDMLEEHAEELKEIKRLIFD